MIEQIEWVEISERMPQPLIDVLIYAPGMFHREIWMGYYDIEEQHWRACDGCKVEGVHSWAPLPLGPIVGGR